MSNYNINVLRDGIDASASARYMQAGVQTATMLNPDLVGELRLIVAPVTILRWHRDIVREWCARDAGQPRSTRTMKLDCLACGACCRDNRVVLEKPDLARWRRAARHDLLDRAYQLAERPEVC